MSHQQFELDVQALTIFKYIAQSEWNVWSDLQKSLSVLRLLNPTIEDFVDPCVNIPKLQVDTGPLRISSMILSACLYRTKLQLPDDLSTIRFHGQMVRCRSSGRIYSIIDKTSMQPIRDKSKSIIALNDGLYSGFYAISRLYLRTILSIPSSIQCVSFKSPRPAHFKGRNSTVMVQGNVALLRCNEPGNIGVSEYVLPSLLSHGIFELPIDLPNNRLSTTTSNVEFIINDRTDLDVLIHQVRIQSVTLPGNGRVVAASANPIAASANPAAASAAIWVAPVAPAIEDTAAIIIKIPSYLENAMLHFPINNPSIHIHTY